MDELKKVLKETITNSNEVKKAIEELVEEEYQQTKQCAIKGRTAAGVLFATSWGFLLQGTSEHNGWLAIVILLSTLYFALDMLRHLWYSRLARKFYRENSLQRGEFEEPKDIDACQLVNKSKNNTPDRLSPGYIRNKLLEFSDKTFSVLTCQIILLAIMVITLGVFVCIKYNIL